MYMVQTCACQFTFLYFGNLSLISSAQVPYVKTNLLLKIEMSNKHSWKQRKWNVVLSFLEVRDFRVLVGVLCRSYVAFIGVDNEKDDNSNNNNNNIKNYKETTLYCTISNFVLGGRWLEAKRAESC